MTRSRGVVVAVFPFHMGSIVIPYTVCPLFGSMSRRHKRWFQHISGRIGRGN